MKLESVEAITIKERNRPNRLARWTVWSLSGLALGLLLAKIAFSLNIMWQIFNFAFQVDESEGMIVAETLLLDQRVDIYAPLTNERFIAAPYTPFYYWLNWPFLHFTGPSFKPGRFISFLALCGIAFLIYKLIVQSSTHRATLRAEFKVQSWNSEVQNSKFQPVKFKTQNSPRRGGLRPKFKIQNWSFLTQNSKLKTQNLFGALFWGSLGLAAFWGGAVKPDVPALFFSLAGVYAVFRFWSASVQNVKGKAEVYSTNQGWGRIGPGNPAPTNTATGYNSDEGAGSPRPSSRESEVGAGSPRPFVGIRQDWRRYRWLYAGGALFALAAMTKQTSVAGPVAALAFLVVCASPMAALRLAGVWLGLAFGPMLIMNWYTNGGFWYHIVTVHELPWSLENYTKFFFAFVQSYQLYILLSVIFVGWWAFDIVRAATSVSEASRNWLVKLLAALRANPFTLFVFYLGTGWAAGISAGTYGGNHNHLLELAVAMCLCSGLVVVRLWQNWLAVGRLRWAYPLILILICLQTLGLFVGEARVKPENFPVLGAIGSAQAGLESLRASFFNPQWLGLEYRVPPAKMKEGLGQVAAFMNNDVGPLIYTDNVSLAIASGKPIMTTDPYTQTHATQLGRWDESRLIELIESKQFHLIVLRAPIEERLKGTGEARDIYLSPGLARAILANYKLTQPNVAFIYEPKK